MIACSFALNKTQHGSLFCANWIEINRAFFTFISIQLNKIGTKWLFVYRLFLTFIPPSTKETVLCLPFSLDRVNKIMPKDHYASFTVTVSTSCTESFHPLISRVPRYHYDQGLTRRWSDSSNTRNSLTVPNFLFFHSFTSLFRLN